MNWTGKLQAASCKLQVKSLNLAVNRLQLVANSLPLCRVTATREASTASCRYCPRAAGFTLVELLVAIGVLALLSVAATTLLGTTLDNQAELRQRGEKLQSLGMALAIMRRDLEQIAPRPGRDERGDPYSEILVTYREEEPELLQFLHLGRRQLPGSFRGSSLERVTYRLQEEKLQRLTAPVADPVAGTPWREQTLMEGVTDVRLEFYDGERWYGEWPPLEGEAGQLPLAVSVVLDTELWRGVRIDVLTADGSDDDRQP